MIRELIEWLKALIFAVIAVFIINMFIGTTTVLNTSMYPTLVEGDLLVISKTADVDRQDIITFKTDMKIEEDDLEGVNPIRKLLIGKDATKNLIKRVIGMPGDTLDIKDGNVYINGELLDESEYLDLGTFGDVHIAKIPEGKYFVMGDNRFASLDSRDEQVGLVSEEDVIGSVLVRLWPINNVRKFW